MHIKTYIASFTKVDIMLLKLQYIKKKNSLMNSWNIIDIYLSDTSIYSV